MAQLKGGYTGRERGIASSGGTRGGGVISKVYELDPPLLRHAEFKGGHTWPSSLQLCEGCVGILGVSTASCGARAEHEP